MKHIKIIYFKIVSIVLLMLTFPISIKSQSLSPNPNDIKTWEAKWGFYNCVYDTLSSKCVIYKPLELKHPKNTKRNDYNFLLGATMIIPKDTFSINLDFEYNIENISNENYFYPYTHAEAVYTEKNGKTVVIRCLYTDKGYKNKEKYRKAKESIFRFN